MGMPTIVAAIRGTAVGAISTLLADGRCCCQEAGRDGPAHGAGQNRTVNPWRGQSLPAGSGWMRIPSTREWDGPWRN